MKVVFAIILTSATGCALLGKSEPLAPHYYSPEKATPAAAAAKAPEGTALRLGLISAGSDIRKNLVIRVAEQELAYDEEQRWTEKPEAYLRRSLARALFEERGVRRVISGPATALEVELVAFEEVEGPPHRVRVSAVVIVHDEREVKLEKTFTVERPVSDNATEAVVSAMGDALLDLVSQIADAATR